MNRPSTALLASALAVLLVPTADAVTTRLWNTATYRDFDEGEATNALITSLAEVMPGFGTERIDLETDAVWTAVRGPDGTLYAGGVSDGAIYAVSGKTKKILASVEKDSPWIGALVLGPDGTLYAGTLGTPVIFAVDTKSGKATKLVTLSGPEHVWALALDPAGKTLYAGTGPNGKLFAVDLGTKQPREVLDLEDNHLLALTRASDGALWIGTSDDAILYRFDPRTGQARAIADFAGTEVKAIVEVDGVFVVASNEFEAKAATTPAPPPAKGPKGTAAKPPEAGTTPGADKNASAASLPPRTGERKGKGALFRVEPDGRVEQLHALSEGYFTSLAAHGHDVYAGAGSQGRIYQIRQDRTVVTAFDVDERQVNAVVAFAGGISFATGDGAAVYTSTGPAKDAKYLSKVFDAQMPSQWGNLRWRGDAGIVLETRSGNTSKPDRGWSEWQRPAGNNVAGGGAHIGRIGSPTARYLQYRVSWTAGSSGALREVTAYYLPQNQRPRVLDATIGETADPSKKAAVTTASGAAKPRSPILKLKWRVENPDEDEIVYTLEYRAEGDADWRVIPTGETPLTKVEFEWNTETLPDGYYRLRVTASDRRVNPRELALQDAYVTPPFLVDNQKPQVMGIEVRAPFASGRAVDSFSRIDEIAYSVDDGDWVVAFPKDGIFDDVSELFTLKLPDGLAPGRHTLTIRVADEADNIGAASMGFRVSK